MANGEGNTRKNKIKEIPVNLEEKIQEFFEKKKIPVDALKNLKEQLAELYPVFEITLINPIKLLVASPIYALDVQKIRSNNINARLLKSGNSKRYEVQRYEVRRVTGIDEILESQPSVIEVALDMVFTSQDNNWIEFSRSAMRPFNLTISMKNIAGIIQDQRPEIKIVEGQ
jgi:hypothetical protein